MPQNRKPDATAPAGQIEIAVNERDWTTARYETLRKLARQLDQTESGRDSKALALSVTQLITECQRDEHDAKATGSDTKLAKILNMAESC